MPSHSRRLGTTLVAVLAALTAWQIPVLTTSQTPQTQQEQTTTGAEAPAAAVRPEQAALNAALAIVDMSDRLAALEKIRTDFPQSTVLATVDTQILQTLTTWPDRTDAMSTVLDRMLGRIPASTTPETRLMQTATTVTPLVTKGILLDRVERLMTDAMTALSFDKFFEARRATAKEFNRPEPQKDAVEREFNQTYRSRGLETLGLIYAARGDKNRAEATLKESFELAPQRSTSAVVEFYKARKDYAAAESILKDALKRQTSPALVESTNVALMDIYVLKGDDRAAEKLAREVLEKFPTNAGANLKLAKALEQKGEHAEALERYLTASAGAGLRTTADRDALRALFTKVRGSDAGLEDAVDAAYRKVFPNPVTPEPYRPTEKRSNRLVLLEMFTGSGCGPCVSADLALDAAMARYEGHVATLAYHANIPAPDPMVVAGGDGRREYYKVSGVPTFHIDGALGQLGGGARTNTPGTYKSYVAKIDKALEEPARATLKVQATGEGESIKVVVDVAEFASDAKDVRLHIALAERELRFTGENGIRFHPFTVRAMAGERGAGVPITAAGTTTWTFNLAAVRDDVTKTLAAEILKRKKQTAGSATASTREYMAEGRAYTDIHSKELVVVAFLQEGPYVAPPRATPATAAAQPAASQTQPPAAPRANVLQAAQAPVLFVQR